MHGLYKIKIYIINAQILSTVCLPPKMFVRMLACMPGCFGLSVCLPVHLFLRESVCQSAHLETHLPTPPFVYLSISLCVVKCLCLSVCMSVCMLVWCVSREFKRGKYHCTVDLLFDWFGISCMTTDYFSFYLQNRLIQTGKTGGQWYSDTSPFIIPWSAW
jgi:hypothetical protein